MALKNQTLVVTYTAWNTATNQPQINDASNHTIVLCQDGVVGSPTNLPAQVNAGTMPGIYSLSLAPADMNFNCVTLGGVSATASVQIIPVTIVTERGVLPSVAPTNMGGFLTVGTGAGQITPDGTTGGVNVTQVIGAPVLTDQPIVGFPFSMTLAGTNNPAPGLTVTATRSINGGAFAPCSNSPTETGNGWYAITLSAADLNGTTVALAFAAAGCDTTEITLVSQ